MLPVSLLCFWSYVVAVKTVGCIGDSITQGGCKYGRNETYTAQLQVLLGNAYNVHNFGVSGMTMLTDGLCGASKPQIPSNCSWVGTPAFPAALAAKADIYTVFLGTNDSKFYNWFGVQNNSGDSYALDYLELLKRLRGLKERVVLVPVIPIPVFVDGQYGMNATVVKLFQPAQIRRIAALVGAPVIDLSGFPGGSLTCDGVHPLPAGNAWIAQTMAKAILRL